MVRAKRWMRKHPSRVTAAVGAFAGDGGRADDGTVLLSQMNRAGGIIRRPRRRCSDSEFPDGPQRGGRDTFTRVSDEKLLDEGAPQAPAEVTPGAGPEVLPEFHQSPGGDPSVRRDLAVRTSAQV